MTLKKIKENLNIIVSFRHKSAKEDIKTEKEQGLRTTCPLLFGLFVCLFVCFQHEPSET